MNPLAIAHRGYHKEYYENTLEAFIEAGKRDYYGIETDVHLTKDNIFVTCHNPFIVSKGVSYFIKDLLYKDIINMPLDNNQGHDDAHVCVYYDYLKVCKDYHKRPIIEIKKCPKLRYLKELCEYIDNYIGIENVTIIAFSRRVIFALKRLYKDCLDLQLLIDRKMYLVNTAIMHNVGIDCDFASLRKEHIESMHFHNLKVNAWTVDDIDELRRLEDYGIDYITSNVFDQNS